jgi:hypothetical protein
MVLAFFCPRIAPISTNGSNTAMQFVVIPTHVQARMLEGGIP